MKYQAKLLSFGSWFFGCLTIMLMTANPVTPELTVFNGPGMWLALGIFSLLYVLPLVGALIKVDYGYHLLTGWLAISLLLFMLAGVPVLFSGGTSGLRLLLILVALLGISDVLFWLPLALVPQRPLQEN
ncbi:hypothetical protein [Loigolactobacillus zhaoyuanensis]|uniref:Uncharacterized protein n=1 Tax=Loigolactobacillus zhaoyuanensis TaxID=2486017 RepID=A0ABW8UA27_9LACO|nr:hypothetical protein [Loigolactobacillus zhaoyuanensis]